MPDNLYTVNDIKNKTTAEIIAEELIEMSNNAVVNIVHAHQAPFNKLWKRTIELGIDPQDVLDALGTNSSVLFARASELIKFILGAYGNTPLATLDPSEYIPPVKYKIVDNKIKLLDNK